MNDHPFTTRPVITLLVEAPLFFKMLPNAQENISMLRSLVETVRTKWTGFQHKKVVNWDSKNFGADGQKYEFYTNVTVEYGQLSMSVWERPGMPVKRFLDFWIDMGLMNEETKYASIATVAGTEAYDALPDMYTMGMLAIEPDVTGRRVNKLGIALTWLHVTVVTMKHNLIKRIRLLVVNSILVGLLSSTTVMVWISGHKPSWIN